MSNIWILIHSSSSSIEVVHVLWRNVCVLNWQFNTFCIYGNMWLSSICSTKWQLGINLKYPIHSRLNGMIEWYESQLNKLRITLMFWKMWELGGSAIVITFLFYPAASCPYHRYWVDNGCRVCGVLPSTVFMEFSGVVFKINTFFHWSVYK